MNYDNPRNYITIKENQLESIGINKNSMKTEITSMKIHEHQLASTVIDNN